MMINRMEQPWFSPPDEPREWARKSYNETFSPSPSATLPTLTSDPEPILDITRSATEIKFKFTTGDRFPTQDQFEIFEPDAAGDVIVPGGNRLRLEAIALVENHKIDWGEKNWQQARPEWLDPETLKPLPEEKTKAWQEEHIQKGSPNRLFLMVSNSGPVPIRWHAAEVFDDRTLLKVHNGSNFHTHSKTGRFYMELDIWHQAPVRVAVNFSFGKPEFRDLKLTEGERVQFGDDGSVRVIAVTPHGFGGSSWGAGSKGADTEHTGNFYLIAKPPRTPQFGLLLHLWPPHHHQMIDLIATDPKGGKKFYGAWGNGGMSSVTLRKDLVAGNSIQVRRLPRLGRAVFSLPEIPALPEVENLLEAPIPGLTVKYESNLRDALATGGGVQWQAWGARNIHESKFPIHVENTSPMELIRLHQKLNGATLYFDREKLSVTDKAATGWMDRFQEWWRKTKPRWFP